MSASVLWCAFSSARRLGNGANARVTFFRAMSWIQGWWPIAGNATRIATAKVFASWRSVRHGNGVFLDRLGEFAQRHLQFRLGIKDFRATVLKRFLGDKIVDHFLRDSLPIDDDDVYLDVRDSCEGHADGAIQQCDPAGLEQICHRVGRSET